MSDATFDPKGTQPGLATPSEPERKVIHMACRKCDSKKAVELTQSAPTDHNGAAHQRVYQCVECNATWRMGVGGHIGI